MSFFKPGASGLKGIIAQNKKLGRLMCLIEAIDSFFWGTDKTTSTTPYILDGIDIKRYMASVVIALFPAVLASIYLYGLRVIIIIIVSYLCGGITEVLFAIFRKKEIHEGFLVTGLIYPLILPPSIPLWMVGVGIIFGVIFGKEVFGGTGRNIFNPAMVGRIFLSTAFPEHLSTGWAIPFTIWPGGFTKYSYDTMTTATPLIDFKTSHTISDPISLLIGTSPGSIGETFRIGIIIGGLFLIFTKIADWRTPVAYLLTSFVLALLTHSILPEKFAPPFFQILSGGLLFGAFFMATDPVTTPFTRIGKWIAGFLLGLLTVFIRGLSGYVEGVMFSIIIVNGISPLIDIMVLNKKYPPRKR